MARIGYVASMTNAIDTHHVGLILDGTGAEKSIPLEHSGSGPIGDIDYCVVVGTLRSAPDGETQIVAYENKETDALDIDHDPLGAGIVGLGLAAHGKEVSLVGDSERAVGMGNGETVEEAAALGDEDGAGEMGMERHGGIDHPLGDENACVGIGGKGLLDETRGEHLGEDVEGGGWGGGYQGQGGGEICGDVGWEDVGLEEGEVHGCRGFWGVG